MPEANGDTKTSTDSSGGTQQHQVQHLHGLRLWLLISGLYLGIYLVALDLMMLSILVPTLTNTFSTLDDVSWYEASYVVAVCVFTPLIGRLYTQLPNKAVYMSFMATFLVGNLLCGVAQSSRAFIAGRVVSGLGAAGLVTGAIIIIGATCKPSIRPLITTAGISMMSVGSMTGPIIAGVLTASTTWRWCFWMLLPIGGATMLITLALKLPESGAKARPLQALRTISRTTDPAGFVLLAATTVTLLLAVTWGGSKFPWSSPTIIGLLCGTVGLAVTFGLWTWHQDEKALIPPSCLCHRTVYVGSAVMFLQGGVSQIIPFYLPFWFQAVRGDGPTDSAVHLLPSLVTNLIALVVLGSTVRKLVYIPPWAIVGSALACIGSGLLTTLQPDTSTGRWVGYQILTTFGRGLAFQVPTLAVQEHVPVADQPMAISAQSVCMQLGIAVGVSAAQTIFRNQLPSLLQQYAPGVDATQVADAGATDVRNLIPPEQLHGFLEAYNQALTHMFYLPVVTSALSVFVAFAMQWEKINIKGSDGLSNNGSNVDGLNCKKPSGGCASKEV